MTIRVEIVGEPSKYMKRAAEITSGKLVPNEKVNGLSRRLLRAEHSPARLMMYWIEVDDVPERAVMHLVRHKIGVEWFVSTSRPDLTDADGKRRNIGFMVNHQALVNIARRRLCARAWHETRELVGLIKANLPGVTADRMVPECEFRGGWCHEPKSCGRCPAAED